MSDRSSDHSEDAQPIEGAVWIVALRRWGRRALQTVGVITGVVFLTVAPLLLVLQTDTGATVAAQWLASTFNPFPNTQLTVQSASGSWIRSLRLTDVSLARTPPNRPNAVSMAHVDTLAVRYRVLPLLKGRLHLTRATLAGPSVTMRQAPDSTWDWGQLFPSGDGAETDTSDGFVVQVDELALTDGAFTASYYAPDGDSIARVRNLQVRAHNVQYASPVTGRLDTLGLEGRLPGDTTDLELGVKGEVSSTSLTLDTLRLDSPRSRVRGHGQLRRPSGPDDAVDDVRLLLQAEPFALRDLTLFAPTLDVDPRETVDLNVRVTGSGRRLHGRAAASFSGGGTIAAETEVTPTTSPAPEGAVLYYRLNTRIRSLTTSLLGPPNAAENQISATLDADLQGRSVSRLDGTVDLRLTDTRWSGLRSPALTLTSTMRNGSAAIQLEGMVNDASLQAEGSARPFDERASADLTVDIDNLQLEAVSPDLGLRGTLAGTTRFRADALGTDDQTLDVDARVRSSQVGDQRIDGGDISLALRPEEARVRGRLALPSGEARANGMVALDGSDRFRLEQARFQNVNVASFAGDTTSSAITGTARIEGRGFSPKTTAMTASVDIDTAHYGSHRLSSLTGQARLDDGRLTTNVEATLNGGTWSVAGAGRPFAPVPRFDLTRGRFQTVDLAPFVGAQPPLSQLQGRLRASIRGTRPSQMTADLSLSLDSSQVQQQPIRSASINVGLQNGTVNTGVMIETPDGGLDLSGTARPFDSTPTYEISDATFTAIDVGAFAGLSALRTHLSGDLRASGRGTTAESLRLDGALSVRESQINGAQLSSGQLSVRAEEERARADGAFQVGDGRIALEGTLDSLSTTPHYTGRVNMTAIDAAALAGRDSLTAQIDTLEWTVDGRGSDLQTLTASTRLTAGRIQLNRLRVNSTTVAGRLRRGQLAVDTLSVEGNAFTSRGSGRLAISDTTATSDFSLRTTLTDGRPIRSLLPGTAFGLQEATIETHVYGASLSSQRFDGSVELANLTYQDIRLSQADLKFNGRRGTDQWLQRFEIDGRLGYLSVPALSVDETAVQATYDGTTIDLSSRVQLDASHRAHLGATVAPTDSQTTVTLTTLDVQMGPDQWSLLQDATIIASDRYRVRGLLLYSGNQQIAADGIVALDGRQSFIVTVEGVQLGTMSPLFGLAGLGGTLSGSIDLTGTATDPILNSRLALDLQSEKQDVGTLEFDATYEALRLDVNAELTHVDGSTLMTSGTIPTDLRLAAESPADVDDAPVSLDVRTTRFPVNWIDPFLDPESVRNVRGILTADVRVRGTLDKPELGGSASLMGGGAAFPPLRTRYRNAAGTLRFADDQVTVEDLVVRSPNDGRLRADGTINFPELTVGEYDLSLKASDFIAIDTRAYQRAIVDGSMTLRGTLLRPVLAGSVQLQSANIFFNEVIEESDATTTVQLSKDDQLTLENRFGIRLSEADTTTFDLYQALELDLKVLIRRNTWLRSRSTPEMNIQFTGDLDVQKAHNEDPQVFGSIEVATERSTLRQFGQQFDITEGTLTFNGDPYTPYLNLAAVYEQRARAAQGTEVQITLRLEGRPEDLSPTLSSDPPMDTRNILSYLATGRPASEIRSGSGNLATQVALGQASNFVENLAASELGLDVVRVELRTTGVSYLTVGRYFTPRLFVSVEQPVTTSNLSSTPTAQYVPDLTVEYQLTETWMLRALNNQRSLQLNLLFEYAY